MNQTKNRIGWIPHAWIPHVLTGLVFKARLFVCFEQILPGWWLKMPTPQSMEVF